MTFCNLQVVGPGSLLLTLPESGHLRVGPGLQALDGSLVSTRGGVLKKTHKGKLWIEGRQKRCESSRNGPL